VIKVLLFAGLKEQLQTDVLHIDVTRYEDGLTLKQLKQQLQQDYPEISEALSQAMFAVNEQFAADDTLLRENDQVAVIPPVSGG
jgi:molybdopterin converting factor subunit 1